MKKLGFTLIEMVITILVVSIMFLAIAGFLEIGTKGYADSVKRQALQNQARFVIEKMSREIRHAVPNSFKVTGSCIEFFPIQYSGFYADRPLSSAVQFIIGTDGFVNTLTDQDYMVINPSRYEDFIGADITAKNLVNCGAGSNVTEPACSVSGDVFTISSSSSSQSVGRRHYVYNQEQRISYCIAGNQITKQIGASTVVPIGDNVVSGSVAYENVSLTRSGLIHLEFNFQQGDEVSEYKHDVQVLNVP